MRFSRLLLPVLLFVALAAKGAVYTFDYNEKCRQAYMHYMSLQFEQGRAVVMQAMKENPYNLMPTFISDYEDCLLLLFNGDKKDLQQMKGHMDLRLGLLSKAEKNTPWYRFSKAGIYMHWALVHLRFSDNFKAAGAFRKSYLLLKENKKLYPSFAYNDVYLGLAETVVGVIPDEYKWIAAIFGMKGSVKKGIGKLDHFIETNAADALMRQEAVVYDLYMRFYLLHDQEYVWKYLNSSRFVTKDNLLQQFVYANIAINYRKAAQAIDVLKAAERNKYHDRYPIFDYEMGSALLNKTDPASIAYLRSFVENFRGNIFIKDAWQKLFQAYLLEDNIDAAMECKKGIMTHGTLMVDADKQAQRFAESNDMPDKRLLAARLLVDGGYYNEALGILGRQDEADFANITSKLEYNFRMGRIHEELGKDAQALSFYSNTVAAGKNRKEYFAARALLQSAFIYEKKGDRWQALNKYKECLELKGHDFQNSIDQMAKAGIDRLQ